MSELGSGRGALHQFTPIQSNVPLIPLRRLSTDAGSKSKLQRVIDDSAFADLIEPSCGSAYSDEGEVVRVGPAGKVLDSKVTGLVIGLATFHFLFSSDLYYLVLPKSADEPVLYVTFVVTLLFVVEILLNGISRGMEYFTSFYFFLDLASVCSAIPDILVLFDAMEPAQGRANLMLTRIGRAARLGTRLGKVGKLVERNLAYPFGKSEVSDFETIVTWEASTGSRIGKEISRRITMKTVCMVLLVVVGSLLVSDPPSSHTSTSHENYLSLSTIDNFHALHDVYGSDLLYLEVNNTILYVTDEDRGSYREVDVSTVDTKNGVLQIKTKARNTQLAIQSVGLTIFVIGTMVVFNGLIIHDVRGVLLYPITRIIRVVDTFMVDPLAKLTWDEAEMCESEPEHLVRSVKKLGMLIQVGFGEAGKDIITQHLRHGTLFTMLPGHSVQAIFAFCDIRSFTTATETLRQDVMFFVNQVSSIVHSTVREHGGMPNKNVGDAFLSTWRLGSIDGDWAGQSMDNIDAQASQQKADASLIFAMQCNERVRADATLKMICSKVGGGYTCSLGFGLHYGWAIEGAIGSEMKIDVSYLSPHVNVATQLEGSTKQYGTSILFSGELYGMLSPRVRDKYSRPVDLACFPNNNLPVLIYECAEQPRTSCTLPPDVPSDYTKLTQDVQAAPVFANSRYSLVHPFSVLYEPSDLYASMESGSVASSTHVNSLETMVSFRKLASMAFAYYLLGSWSLASKCYQALQEHNGDKVSASMMVYLKLHGGKCPKSWAYRDLGK